MVWRPARTSCTSGSSPVTGGWSAMVPVAGETSEVIIRPVAGGGAAATSVGPLASARASWGSSSASAPVASLTRPPRFTAPR